jgi:hypothetical protein
VLPQYKEEVHREVRNLRVTALISFETLNPVSEHVHELLIVAKGRVQYGSGSARSGIEDIGSRSTTKSASLHRKPRWLCPMNLLDYELGSQINFISLVLVKVCQIAEFGVFCLRILIGSFRIDTSITSQFTEGLESSAAEGNSLVCYLVRK